VPIRQVCSAGRGGPRAQSLAAQIDLLAAGLLCGVNWHTSLYQSIDLLVRSSLSVLLVGCEAWLQRSVWDQIDLIDQSCVSWTPSDITGRERGDKETK